MAHFPESEVSFQDMPDELRCRKRIFPENTSKLVSRTNLSAAGRWMPDCESWRSLLFMSQDSSSRVPSSSEDRSGCLKFSMMLLGEVSVCKRSGSVSFENGLMRDPYICPQMLKDLTDSLEKRQEVQNGLQPENKKVHKTQVPKYEVAYKEILIC